MKYLKSLAKAILPKACHTAVKDLYLRSRALFYFGNKFTCPCCGGHFRKFLTRGIRSRPNAECPRCGSVERHRLLWLYFQDRTNLFSDNLRVLHFAPEHAFQRVLSTLSNLDYISADLASTTAMVKMDITNIQYETNSFDVVLCNHVLEHVPDDQKAMREMFRVLKPDGWAVLQAPIDPEASETCEHLSVVSPEQRTRLFGHPEHVRVYGRDYKDRLERAGYVVSVDSYARELGLDVIKRFGLIEDEDIYFCTKPRPKGDW